MSAHARETVSRDQCVHHGAVAAFEQALRARPDALEESHYAFGGRGVRLRVVGRALAWRISRPFAHLRAHAPSGEPPELTIDLWDERETGVPHPSDSIHHEASERWRVGGGFATSYEGGRVFRYEQPESITWLDRGARRIIGWRACGQRLAPQEQSKPLPLLLAIWYYDRDIHIVHAGLVARQGQGVLVGGASGAGKTTTTAACLLTGFHFLGDDQSGLQAQEDGSFVGHSLYSGARVEPHHVKHFPHLLPHTDQDAHTSEDKVLMFLSEILPDQLAPAASIRAIALPRITSSERSRVRRASGGEALLRLAPTSLFTAFGPGSRGFERLGQLVGRVPSYWLELGSDVAGIPACVDQILNEALCQN